MALNVKPFFDPGMAEFQRQLQLETSRGIADLNLKDARLKADVNLMRPFMERRFGQQMNQAAGSVAERGFSGSKSGIMTSQLSSLGEDQAFSRGQFEQRFTRERDDIQRLIDRLNQDATVQGAESTRRGAANAASRREGSLSF